VLRVAGPRLLDERDRSGVQLALDADPVAACMVASRVELAGVDSWRLGGELWGVGNKLEGLCFAGANLVPLRGERLALRAMASMWAQQSGWERIAETFLVMAFERLKSRLPERIS